MTGDDEPRTDPAVELARLRVERRQWYDEPATDVRVPHPARPLGEDPGSTVVRAAAAVMSLLAAISAYDLGQVAEQTGHHSLSGVALLFRLGCSGAGPCRARPAPDAPGGPPHGQAGLHPRRRGGRGAGCRSEHLGSG